MTHSFPTRLSSDLTGVGASEVLAGVGGNGMEAKVMPGNGCQVVSITHEVPAHPVLYTSERRAAPEPAGRSEEHTSELRSLMRISYAVFCLKKKQHMHYQPRLTTTNTLTVSP